MGFVSVFCWVDGYMCDGGREGGQDSGVIRVAQVN